jgi:hypothetical protein
MAFPSDGRNHWAAVDSEKNISEYTPWFESQFGKTVKEILHLGGTKTTVDFQITFDDDSVSVFSLKRKKQIKTGSFDYVNTANFDKNLFKESIKLIDSFRKSGNRSGAELIKSKIHEELSQTSSETLTNLFRTKVIEKYEGQSLQLVLLEENTKTLHLVHPKIFKLLSEGHKLTLSDNTKGKTSWKVLCVSLDGSKLDLGLRVRVHLNNGITKLVNKDDGGSYLCLKFQQDSVHKLFL